MIPPLREKLYDPDYGSAPERMFVFHIDAWDVNCPQHIKPRFTEEEVGESMQALRDRIAKLEADCCNCEPKESQTGRLRTAFPYCEPPTTTAFRFGA